MTGISGVPISPFGNAPHALELSTWLTAQLPDADTLLDNCIMMWGSGLEDGDQRSRANLPFIIAGKGGGTINTGRFLPDTKGNQGDLLTTILACADIPLDRPIGIATKQINEMTAVDLLRTYSAPKKNSSTSPNLLLHAASLC